MSRELQLIIIYLENNNIKYMMTPGMLSIYVNGNIYYYDDTTKTGLLHTRTCDIKTLLNKII